MKPQGKYPNYSLNRLLFTAFLVLTLVTVGCSADNNANTHIPTEEQVLNETTDNTQETPQEIEWVVEPHFAFTGIKEFTPLINYSGWGNITELIGYPDEWEKQYSHLNHLDYTGNAIEVIAGNKSGIYDYNGHELFPISINKPVLNPFSKDSTIVLNYLCYCINGDCTRSFTSDFTELESRNPSTEYSFITLQTLRVKDWALKIFNHQDGTYSSPESLTDYPRSEYYSLVPEYDDEESFIGYVIMDGKYNLINRVMSDDTDKLWIVNRMILVNEDGKYSFQSAETGEVISDYIYDDAKLFMDGYAPVKKDGKWGFIDMKGNEITDFMFDDASNLYKGNTYVSIDGVYGIINLVDLLNKGYEITPETCKVNPEMIKSVAELKANMLIPIGTATVNVDNLNVRVSPSTDADLAAESQSIAEGTVFDIYAITESEGYTWYQIDDNMWIADKDGEWITKK